MQLLQLFDSADQKKLEELIIKHGISIDQLIDDPRWDYKLLRNAIRKGNLEITKFLVEQGCSVNKIVGPFSVTSFLHIAVEGQYIDIVRLLLEKGAPIDQKNRIGETPLILAAKVRNEEIIDLLLQKLENTEDESKSGLEEIHVACIKGHLDIIDRIVRSGVSINKQVSLDSSIWPSYTPLHLTVLCGHYEVLLYLLDSGADLNATTVDDKTALHLALQLTNICEDIVKLLLKRGANINPTLGTTMLHIAAEHSNAHVVGILLENGAKVNVFNKAGVTPLQIAIKRGNLKIVKLLIENNADVNCADKKEKETPLHFAVKFDNHTISKLRYEHYEENEESSTQLHFTGEDDLYEIVRLLLKHGADINLKNNRGQTPLHYLIGRMDKYSIAIENTIGLIVSSQRYCTKLINPIDENGLSHFHAACICGESKVVLDFIKRGEDVNQSVKDRSNRWSLYTPLLFAFEKKLTETVTLLLLHGADVNPNLGTTTLHQAVSHMDRDIVRMILESGAAVNVYDKDGNTPLHLAVMRGDLEIVKLLIQYKADLNCTDNSRCTPLHIAIIWKHMEIFDVLLRNGANVNTRVMNGRTVLHFIVSNQMEISKLDMKIAERLNKLITSVMKAGADINAQDLEGFAPLYLAYTFSPNMFYVLLEHGANIASLENISILADINTPARVLNINILNEHKAKMRVRLSRAHMGFFPKYKK